MTAAPNGWAESFGTKDLLDRGCRDHHADAFQFADDPLIAPPRILPGTPHNQCANVRWDRWSTGWPRIGPALCDQEPVPPEERRRRDDKRRPVDAWQQSACCRQEQPVGRGRYNQWR